MKNKFNKIGQKPMAWTELNNKKPETEVENRKNEKRIILTTNYAVEQLSFCIDDNSDRFRVC